MRIAIPFTPVPPVRAGGVFVRSRRLCVWVLWLCSIGIASAQEITPPGTVSKSFDPFTSADTLIRLDFEADKDLDFDRFPDDWVRRTGPRFPHYIDGEIDRDRGANGSRYSFRFTPNGGAAAIYSPAVPIDADHTYIVQAAVRTDRLLNDAGVISVSLLNARRERVARLLSTAVSGTHEKWVPLRFGPLAPTPEVRFIVIGCHLVAGDESDLAGGLWFDQIRIGQLPRMDLASNFHAHFVQRNAPIEVNVKISGLDAGWRTAAVDLLSQRLLAELGSFSAFERETDRPVDTLGLQLRTREGTLIATKEFSLSGREDESSLYSIVAGPQTIRWDLPPQDYGHYEVRATLRRDGQVMLTRSTMLGVLDLIEQAEPGEFGWVFGPAARLDRFPEMPNVILQGGVNWLATPVWRIADDRHSQRAKKLRILMDTIAKLQVESIAMLLKPPDELRRKFSDQWSGVAEVFEMPGPFWRDALTPVVTRFATGLRHWQLGDDRSFEGRADLGKVLERIKAEFDRTGRNSRLILPWKDGSAVPLGFPRHSATVLLDDPGTLNEAEREAVYRRTAGFSSSRWVQITPMPVENGSLEERTADLVQRMIHARRHGVGVVLLSDVFDERTGLLNPEGSPRPLFLPWRTTALLLRGSEPIGEFRFLSGTKSAVFERGDDAILALWNDTPTTETVPLGPRVELVDVWGHRGFLTPDAEARVELPVGPTPVFVRGVSPGLVKFRLALNFERGTLDSEVGAHIDRLVVQNPFSQGISGHVSIQAPKDWDIEPRDFDFQLGRGEQTSFPVRITLPANVGLGMHRVKLDATVNADRPYRLELARDLEVLSDDLELTAVSRLLPDGRLEVEQLLINNTSPPELMNFQCYLYAPGRRRQKQVIPRLKEGSDRKFYYFPNGKELLGQPLWLRIEQTDGRRILNYRWTASETVD